LIGIVVKFNSNEYQDILDFSDELSKEYIRSKIKISNIIQEGNLVSVRYKHVVKTIENPRDDMLLAKFFAIWEIKDGKLFKGFQMSHIS
jgi:predicted SnoaL-like aldol condensation-catalyzing enzyme